jgi:alkane 1-monooxygenase
MPPTFSSAPSSGSPTQPESSQPPTYRDRKRLAWLFSVGVPAIVLMGPLLMMRTGDARLLWAPVVFFYGVAPLLDLLLGEDLSNPPESSVPQLEADRYYRLVCYLLVPVLWSAFIFSAWFVARHALPWWGVLAMVMTTGSVGGFCINLGHELGHKQPLLDRTLARLVLAPTGYGHFSIEHNRGHHRDVATPGDPASARMGESIYAFVLREMPGALQRAWALEASRLALQQRTVWSPRNEILHTGLVTLALWVGLAIWLGPGILVFVMAASFWANFQLTSANYVEHYGLLRKRLPSGRYEPCQPRHSWNSNHVFSNWALFHLQRHSDHHAHPLRHYQSLRHFDEAPQLPLGYFGMFPLSYFPPLWRRVMDPRLLAAVGRDTSRLNIQPSKREALMRRWGLVEAPPVG